MSYDRAWDLALQSAQQMCEEGKRVNHYNFPFLVSLGTSKSRRVITIKYDYDPAAGSVGTTPPNAEELIAKQFVPRFGAEFYMHIRLVKKGDEVRRIRVEVTQMKGINKEEFVREAENLKNYYLSFLRQKWGK